MIVAAKGRGLVVIIEHRNALEIQDIGAFSPQHTFECGQCFRFTPHAKGGYAGVAFGRFVRIWCSGGSLFLEAPRSDFDQIWRSFLDLNRDYSQVDRLLCQDPQLREAVNFGRGLRVLAQDPWEALCTFILSQCCNIPRIRCMTETLCRLFGAPVDGVPDAFSFPTPQTLARCTADDLAPVRAGYRARYLLGAARRISEGFDLDALRGLSTDQARERLTSLEGVGRKVADCVLLFGLHKLDAFPVDTWMKKASGLWSNGFPTELFGETAGIAQQYIFYYVRSQKSIRVAQK